MKSSLVNITWPKKSSFPNLSLSHILNSKVNHKRLGFGFDFDDEEKADLRDVDGFVPVDHRKLELFVPNGSSCAVTSFRLAHGTLAFDHDIRVTGHQTHQILLRDVSSFEH